MSDGSLVERLVSLLGDVIGRPGAALGAEASQANTPDWDSVANLGFIAAVEDEFGIAILTAEAMQLRSIADMAELLRRKGVAG